MICRWPHGCRWRLKSDSAAGMLKVTSSDGEVQTRVYPTIHMPTRGGLCADFLEAIRGERDVPCSAEDARDALIILEAIARSLSEGGRVDLQ